MVIKLFQFIVTLLRNMILSRKYFYLIYRHFINIGLKSLFIIGATLFFLGASLVLNAYLNIQIQRESIIPKLVLLSMLREAAPMFAALMLNARIGSAITAEIANMKITNQLDAMKFLNVSPIKYLIIPRQYALMLVSPLLFVISNIIGVLGGLVIYSVFFKYNPHIYLHYILESITQIDIYIGLLKTFVFCQLIGISSSFFGLNCGHTTQDLTKSTINSIVFTSINILIFNYIITQVFT